MPFVFCWLDRHHKAGTLAKAAFAPRRKERDNLYIPEAQPMQVT